MRLVPRRVAEYRRDLLDGLARAIGGRLGLDQPRERNRTVPARPLLIAAMNPCKCGWLGHPIQACQCTPPQLQHYAARLSGPVLDRLALIIEVPALTSAELLEASAGEPTGWSASACWMRANGSVAGAL